MQFAIILQLALAPHRLAYPQNLPATRPAHSNLPATPPNLNLALSNARVYVAERCVAAGLGSYRSPLANPLLWGAENLCNLVFPEQFGAVRDWHDARVNSASSLLEAAVDEINDALRAQLPEASYTVTARVKSALSLFDKLFLRGKAANDMLALRIILKDNALGVPADLECHERCAEVAELVRRLWVEKGIARDYVSFPKANGYQSIHMNVQLPGNAPLEVQIRTEEMHSCAESGSASHDTYKLEAARSNHGLLVWH
jgi:(p)ppGpp synthase/HD superfamily hydrolase